MTRAVVPAVLVLLLLPAAAAAQEPAPLPVPAISLEAAKVHVAGRTQVVLRKRAWRVNGSIAPAVAGGRVRLQVFRNGRKLKKVRPVVQADGTFTHRFKPRRTGRYSVRAYHDATAALAASKGPKESVEVIEPRASMGSGGAIVRLLQRGLDELHYAVPRNDSYDAATGRAVMAFRKVNGMARSYDADRAVIEKVLAGRGAFKVRHPDAGHHVEADISRQVLALIEGGKVVDTYHTSSGAPATPTVIGSFRVYMKDPGVNAKGMVKSNYFIRGYAIHGYVDVPAFNASHGCLRVPIPDAARIYAFATIGTRVIVYP